MFSFNPQAGVVSSRPLTANGPPNFSDQSMGDFPHINGDASHVLHTDDVLKLKSRTGRILGKLDDESLKKFTPFNHDQHNEEWETKLKETFLGAVPVFSKNRKEKIVGMFLKR